MPLIHEMNYVLSSRTYCHNIQKSTRMPWDFLSIGKMSHCGDSGLVFGLTYPNTFCHKVLLLMMILTSAFIYFCNTDFLLFPCVLIVAVATK